MLYFFSESFDFFRNTPPPIEPYLMLKGERMEGFAADAPARAEEMEAPKNFGHTAGEKFVIR